MLEGHKLSLQLSRAKEADQSKGGAGRAKGGGSKEAGTTKVVVRNVAFEATRKVGRVYHFRARMIVFSLIFALTYISVAPQIPFTLHIEATLDLTQLFSN